jgi:hypothetical protein
VSVAATTVTVGTTAVALHSGSSLPTDVLVQAVGALVVGGSDVTTTDGYPMAAAAERSFRLLPGEVLYAVAASGTTAKVLVT